MTENTEKTHNQLILDQFTRQGPLFARAERIHSEEVLNRIVGMAAPSQQDTVLDVACGPGLVTCAFARHVRHATGLDLTPAMLELAREEQDRQKLGNLSWELGDATALPYPDSSFSIVCTRFSLHHLPEPGRVVREMHRVCQPGGRIVVADSAPQQSKAAQFNAFERLRDPSHTRALPVEELSSLLSEAGFQRVVQDFCRIEGSFDELLQRSFPNPGDGIRLRRLMEDSLLQDSIDLTPRRENGTLMYFFPVAILRATKPV